VSCGTTCNDVTPGIWLWWALEGVGVVELMHKSFPELWTWIQKSHKTRMPVIIRLRSHCECNRRQLGSASFESLSLGQLVLCQAWLRKAWVPRVLYHHIHHLPWYDMHWLISGQNVHKVYKVSKYRTNQSQNACQCGNPWRLLKPSRCHIAQV
jgi:hypothetical protein